MHVRFYSLYHVLHKKCCTGPYIEPKLVLNKASVGGLYKHICQMSKPDRGNLGFRLGIRLRMKLRPHRSKTAPHSLAEE